MKVETELRLKKWLLRIGRAVLFFTAIMYVNITTLFLDRWYAWLPLCVVWGFIWGHMDDWFQTKLLDNTHREYEHEFEAFCDRKIQETARFMEEMTRAQVRN